MFVSETTTIDPIFSLVPWVVLLPAIGLILNLLVGKRLGERGAGILASLASGLSFVLAIALALALRNNHFEAVAWKLADWIIVGNLNLSWMFRVDTLSVTMMLVVAGVGTLIHIYAIGYMYNDVRHNGDPGRYRRFFVFFNLFIVAMMLLVTADNYLMLFVGWEGVGLCSYLLIGFWFEKGAEGIGNAKAAKKAFIVNRIGDFGLLLAIFMIFWLFGSLGFDQVFEQAPQVAAVAPAAILAITLFMLLGVTGKSAQLPLYVWLPDAMAGPTPVSALIHAATMVTAGVYLIARSAPLYTLAPLSQGIVTWVGALTALLAATIAIGQFDIKKVLAYSTISQLGYMVAAVGMGAFAAGMFHLVTHAFFKALLFLSAGSVIQGIERGMEAEHHGGHGHAGGHGDLDPQDMRNMGGLRLRMKTTFWVYLAGALALAGIAPLAGFFSKDEILATASKTTPTVYVILAVAAFLTAFYMGRQVFMVFFGKGRTQAVEKASESPAVVTVPLVILAILSIIGGGLNLPGLNHMAGWLEHTIEHEVSAGFVAWVALLSLILALLAILLAWRVYGKGQPGSVHDPDPLAVTLRGFYRGMENKWWVDEFYRDLLVEPYTTLADDLAQPVDLGFVDKLSAWLADFARLLGRGFNRLQNGFIHSYALSILVGVVLVMLFLLTRLSIGQ